MVENEMNEMPFLLKALPFAVGGGYFAYSYWYKKKGYKMSAGVAGALFLLTAAPWAMRAFGNSKPSSLGSAVIGGGAPAPSASSDSTTGDNISSHLNAMDSTGRKAAIDYIIAQEAKMDASKRYFAGALPSSDQRKAAFSTLTNDELKVLYCMYHFIEDRQSIYQKYGSTQSDALSKKVAKEMYSIDLSGIDNVENTASIAITKTMTALNLK